MRTELVTTLKRKATEIIADLQSDQDPVLITQHGKPAAYLMAVEAFDALNRRLGILEGIARGERAIEDGRVVTHAEAKKRMSSKPLPITSLSTTRGRHGVLFNEFFNTSRSFWNSPRAVLPRQRCGSRVTARLSMHRVACSIATTASESSCFTSCVVRCVSARLGLSSVIETSETPNEEA